MDAYQSLSSLNFEIRIIRAKNICFTSTGQLFVRCYFAAGNKNVVRVDSHEISTKSDLTWNKESTMSLDCLGTKESIDALMQGSFVLELRCRYSNKASIFGRIMGGSRLLARAVVPWKRVLESCNFEMEEWVTMLPRRSSSRRVHDDDVKMASVQVGMKVRIEEAAVVETARRGRLRKRRNVGEECGCMDGHGGGGCKSCGDCDFFAIAAALEGF